MSCRLRTGRSQLSDLRQSGSARVLFSHGAALSGILINTAGGLTGGDRFRVSADVGPAAALTLTTQAAERIYRSHPDQTAHITNRLAVRAGGRLNWLPQETLIFDHGALRRQTDIHLEDRAIYLGVESLVFGRQAMGEVVRHGQLRDNLRLYRAGRLVFADAIRLEGDPSAALTRPGVANGAQAVASVIFASHDAAQQPETLRALLPQTAGVSVPQPGILFVRLVAPDAFALRAALIPVLTSLASGPLPRSWIL